MTTEELQKLQHIPTAEIEADLQWTTAAIDDVLLQIDNFRDYQTHLYLLAEMRGTIDRLRALQDRLKELLKQNQNNG